MLSIAPTTWQIDLETAKQLSDEEIPPDPTKTLQPSKQPTQGPRPTSDPIIRRHKNKMSLKIGGDAVGDQRGGCLIVPKTILAPPTASLPIGSVISPADISYISWISLMWQPKMTTLDPLPGWHPPFFAYGMKLAALT